MHLLVLILSCPASSLINLYQSLGIEQVLSSKQEPAMGGPSNLFNHNGEPSSKKILWKLALIFCPDEL
jgi:hypothetical protein